MGRTWAEGKRIDTGLSRAFFLQNVLTRLSSGRLLLPVFAQYGWGYPPHDQRIITGGYVDGEFTPTGAHCYEATVGVCYVVYSDDQGQTWQRNLDCELVIYLDDGSFHGLFEPSVAEVKPGTLLMFMRNLLGRIFESWSYDNGETWSPPQPTQLSASGSPSLIQKLPATDDLLCIWNQQSAEEMRLGYYRTRLSAAVSRNGGGLWEFFQNVESIHEQRRIEPSPLHMARPQGQFALHPGKKAYENDPSSVVDLDERFGIWTNHTFCVLEDRVLVIYAGKCKILPLNWFYRGRDPHAESPLLQKLMHGTHGS